MKDILDLLGKIIEVDEYTSYPRKYKNTSGSDLFGYLPEDLGRAMIIYNNLVNKKEFTEARKILEEMNRSLAIETLSMFTREFYSNIPLKELEDCQFGQDILLTLMSVYTGKSKDEINEILTNREKNAADRWKEIVPNEAEVTEAQLHKFYGTMKFPEGVPFNLNAQSNLTIAYNALPMLLAKSEGLRRVFDFGGNTGESISILASNIKDADCLLIEDNEEVMKFAEWRNNLKDINNMRYSSTLEMLANFEDYAGKFDFGICTEVLEHMYDVEGTVQMLADLLEPKGVLFMSASFGLPQPSHLLKNRVYADKEKELMAKYGFTKVNATFPIPLLVGIDVYVKD